MNLRFRKTIKLAPGIRWNLSGIGSSFTFGPPGASLNVGSRGSFLNTGFSGTGLYSRQRISEPARAATKQTKQVAAVAMTCGVHDDGSLYFRDEAGNEVAEKIIEIAKKQNKVVITELIQRKCNEINSQIDMLGQLHHNTPDAHVKPNFSVPTFESATPLKPAVRTAGFFEKFFKSKMQRIEAENQLNESRYLSALDVWHKEKSAFESRTAYRKSLIEDLIYRDANAMAEFLELSLLSIEWPRETTVDFDIGDKGQTIVLNVDLPEIEMMPTKTAAVPARGLKLSIKDLSATKVQQLYMEHIHSIAFRLIGQTLATLPQAQVIVFSGYSQRRNPATGQIQDDYLLSVRVQRKDWLEIDFNHLTDIDVVQSLSRYELRRELSRSSFKKIEPFVQ
jgi:Protein of unknown function (DUF4236)